MPRPRNSEGYRIERGDNENSGVWRKNAENENDLC